MSNGHVGKLNVTLEGTDKSLGATMKKGAKDVKAFADSAQKDIERVAKGGGSASGGVGAAPEESGMWGDIAKRVKKFRAESRKSGENALAQTLGSGRGLTDAGLQALGLGVQGVVTESVGRGFAGAGETVKKLAAGELSGKEFVNQLAEGVPILGEYVKGWSSILSVIDGSAKAEADLNRQMKNGQMVGEAFHGLMAAPLHVSAQSSPTTSRARPTGSRQRKTRAVRSLVRSGRSYMKKSSKRRRR